MNTTSIKRLMLAGVFAIAFAGVSPADAQSTLGGAKPQPNKIGGIAKPPPVVGGATIHTPPPAPPKIGPVVNVAKPGSTGALTPGSASTSRLGGQVAGNPAPRPSFTPPNKGGPVVTASSTPKCATGTCAPKGPKP
jgi:hypothetical protein